MRQRICFLALAVFLAARAWAGVEEQLDAQAGERGIKFVRDQDIDTTANGEKLVAEAPGAKLWAAVAPVLLAEIEKYPPALTKFVGLQEIVVVKNLKAGDTICDVLTTRSGKLYFDAAMFAYDRRLQRQQFARAIYSMVKLEPAQQKSFETAWARLNPPGFRYSPPRFGTSATASMPGFFNAKSRWSQERDQGTLFGQLMTDQTRLEFRCGRDSIVRDKAALMRQTLGQALPALDESFWRQLAQRQDQLSEEDRGTAMADPKGYVQEQLLDLAAQYGVEIVWHRVPAPAYFRLDTPASPEATDKYGSLLIKEVGRYPRDIIRRAELKRIVLCGKMTGSGLGMSVRDLDTLYLLAQDKIKDEGDTRLTIHHELFHLIDDVDDGTMKDPAWEALNPEGFKYAYVDSGFEIKDAIPGFVDKYATSAVMEDKAETFGYMMISYGKLMRRAEKDSVLASKIAMLKKILRRFCPSMDDAFWDKQAASSAEFVQRWVPGRYRVKTTHDVDEDAQAVAGMTRNWGSSEYVMTIPKPDVEGRQKILLDVTRLVSNLRAGGMTLSYDSSGDADRQDRVVKMVSEPFVGKRFEAVVNERGRVDSVHGFNAILEKVAEDDETAALRIRGMKSAVEGGIRFIAVPDLANLLPRTAVRPGDGWKGVTLLCYRNLPETEFPVNCTMPRVEGQVGVIAFVGSTKQKSKVVGGDGKPTGEETNIAAGVEGEIGVNMRTGMLVWAKQKLTVLTEDVKTVSYVTTRITPEEE